jgi:hypothetical protein
LDEKIKENSDQRASRCELHQTSFLKKTASDCAVQSKITKFSNRPFVNQHVHNTDGNLKEGRSANREAPRRLVNLVSMINFA